MNVEWFYWTNGNLWYIMFSAKKIRKNLCILRKDKEMKELFIEELKVKNDDLDIILKYTVFEENLNTSSDIKMYGVRIDMEEKSGDALPVFSSKSVHSMFSNRKQIDDFVKVLIINEVTPTTLECIAEEYVVDLLYVE